MGVLLAEGILVTVGVSNAPLVGVGVGKVFIGLDGMVVGVAVMVGRLFSVGMAVGIAVIIGEGTGVEEVPAG